MRLKSDLVLKLGGSVITVKDTPMLPDLQRINGIAREFSLSYEGRRVLLVYGGGSFGHPVAKKYLDRTGRILDPNGIAETRHAMHKLTSYLADAFLSYRVPFFAIAPSACFHFREVGGSCEVEHSLRQIYAAFSSGLVPAVGGDVVLTSEGGGRILSGDTIARILARETGASLLAFGTDVDGYLQGGRVLNRISSSELPRIIAKTEGRFGDVTGGMAGKLREIERYMAAGGAGALIFNASRSENIRRILSGETVEGTYIYG